MSTRDIVVIIEVMCMSCFSYMDARYESGRKAQLVFCPSCGLAHKVRSSGGIISVSRYANKKGDDLYRCPVCKGNGSVGLVQCRNCDGKRVAVKEGE